MDLSNVSIKMQQKTGNNSLQSRRPLSSYAVPLCIIAFCLWAFWLSTQFDRVPPILKRGMQPSDFPQLMIGLIVVLSTWLLFRDKSAAPEQLSRNALVSMGLLVGFVLVARIDLFLGLAIFAASLAAHWGERRVWALLTVGLLAPFTIFLLFDGIFEVRFPRGVITDFWYE